MKHLTHLTFGLEELSVNAPNMAAEPVVAEDAQTLFDDLKSRQDVVMAIESVATMLRKDEPATVSKSTLRLANMACNAYLNNIQIDMQELPVDLTSYDRSPAVVVEKGADNIDAEKHKVIDTLREPLANLLNLNAASRKAFCLKVEALKARMAQIQACMGRGMVPDATSTLYLKDASDAAPRLLYPEGFVHEGATVMHDLSFFLTEHEHMFKRLVKKQIAWMVDHADNLGKTSRPLAQYSFDPGEYRCCDAESAPAHKLSLPLSESEDAFRTKPLPGLKALYFVCRNQRVFGAEAIDALEGARVTLGDYDTVMLEKAKEFWNNPELGKIPMLCIETLQARFEETKRAIGHLEYWGEMTYLQLWKDACFETVVLGHMLEADAQTSYQRMVGEVARATMQQLMQASIDVGDYAIETIDAMVGLIEYCLEK